MTSLVESRILNHVVNVISEVEKIPHEKLKASMWFDYVFLTDGERLFRVIITKRHYAELMDCVSSEVYEVHDFSLDNWYSEMIKEKMNDGYSEADAQSIVLKDEYDLAYREIKSSKVKIYLKKSMAAKMALDGLKVHQTLNGSRNGFNNYLVIPKEVIFEEASEIYEFKYPDYINFMLEAGGSLLVKMKQDGVNIFNVEKVREYIKNLKDQTDAELAFCEYIQSHLSVA